MTTVRIAETPLPQELRDDVAAHAAALDAGGESARRAMPALGERGLFAQPLPETSALLADLASVCMSTGFGAWAHRVTLEYLRVADTGYARGVAAELERGERLGVTGMASAFKAYAGCGELDLTAREVDGGFVVDGVLRWASNLYPDSVLVSAAQVGDRRIVFALSLDAAGIEIGKPFSLLGLGSTASSSLSLTGVHVPQEQVLTADFEEFVARVRPTFSVLQTSLCLGLAGACVPGARAKLSGVNAVLQPAVDDVARRIDAARLRLADFAQRVGTAHAPTARELLELRLEGAELATQAAGLEVRTAGGAGYASKSPASRRFREASFLPVQSPSEAQLRWELEQLDAADQRAS